VGREVTRRQALLAVPLVAAVAGCTSGSGPGAGPGTTMSATTTPVIDGSHGAQRRSGSVQLVEGADGPATVAVSSALFEWSTVAVVVADAGSSTLGPAAGVATALGAPLLVASDTTGAELERLRVRLVLGYPTAASVEASAASALATSGGKVVDGPTGADGLPGLGLPVPLPTTGATSPAGYALWTRAAPASAAVAAAVAAAGVTTMLLSVADPRQAPTADAALLASAKDVPVLAVGAAFGPAAVLSGRLTTVRTVPQLPGGGWTPFPEHRLVALYGRPGNPTSGPLGQQGVDASVARAKALAGSYARYSGLPVVPALEIIASAASVDPGPRHRFSVQSSPAALLPWVEAAGKAGMYVLLDLQPGRAEFVQQAKVYLSLLQRPHVSLALDPRFRVGKGAKPYENLGSVDGSEVNAVIAWLAALVSLNNLPVKPLVIHEYGIGAVRRRNLLSTSHTDVQLVSVADGRGTPSAKAATARSLRAGLRSGEYVGWTNSATSDTPPMSAKQTMTGVHPTPWYVCVQ